MAYATMILPVQLKNFLAATHFRVTDQRTFYQCERVCGYIPLDELSPRIDGKRRG